MKDLIDNENTIIEDLKNKIQVLEEEKTELLKRYEESIDSEIKIINEYITQKKKFDTLQKKYNKVNPIYLIAKKNKLIRNIYYFISNRRNYRGKEFS